MRPLVSAGIGFCAVEPCCVRVFLSGAGGVVGCSGAGGFTGCEAPPPLVKLEIMTKPTTSTKTTAPPIPTIILRFFSLPSVLLSLSGVLLTSGRFSPFKGVTGSTSAFASGLAGAFASTGGGGAATGDRGLGISLTGGLAGVSTLGGSGLAGVEGTAALAGAVKGGSGDLVGGGGAEKIGNDLNGSSLGGSGFFSSEMKRKPGFATGGSALFEGSGLFAASGNGAVFGGTGGTATGGGGAAACTGFAGGDGTGLGGSGLDGCAGAENMDANTSGPDSFFVLLGVSGISGLGAGAPNRELLGSWSSGDAFPVGAGICGRGVLSTFFCGGGGVAPKVIGFSAPAVLGGGVAGVALAKSATEKKSGDVFGC